MRDNARKTCAGAWLKTRHMWAVAFLLTTFIVIRFRTDVARFSSRNASFLTFDSKQADVKSRRDRLVHARWEESPRNIASGARNPRTLSADVSKAFRMNREANSGTLTSHTTVKQAVQKFSVNATRRYLTKSLSNGVETVKRVPKPPASQNRTAHTAYEHLVGDTKTLLLNRFATMHPQAEPSQVKRILEVAYFRSGSSFLGQLLSANPGTFYHFEPLRTLSKGVRLSGVAGLRGLDYMADFFNCVFDNHTDHLRLAMKFPHPFKLNTYLWSACDGVKTVCLDPDFLSSVCMTAPVQVMKVVRIDVDSVQRFLRTGPPAIKGALSVVHLVRDPRAIWLSRQRLAWCRNNGNCSSAAVLCADIERDMDAFDRLSQERPGRAVQVRYEDVALDPFNTALKLYNALGLPYTLFVREFIESHTREKDAKVQRNPYATSRNSADVVYAWRQTIKPLDVERVNRACRRVIERLGYKL